MSASEKPTNPKTSIAIAKVPMSTVPAGVLAEVGLAMMEGALKYGRHNFREAGGRASVYYDAAQRHLMAWWEGQDNDPDTGGKLSHLTKAIASLVVLRDLQLQGKLTDDRSGGKEIDYEKLNAVAKGLLERYASAPGPVSSLQAAALKDFGAGWWARPSTGWKSRRLPAYDVVIEGQYAEGYTTVGPARRFPWDEQLARFRVLSPDMAGPPTSSEKPTPPKQQPPVPLTPVELQTQYLEWCSGDWVSRSNGWDGCKPRHLPPQLWIDVQRANGSFQSCKVCDLHSMKGIIAYRILPPRFIPGFPDHT